MKISLLHKFLVLVITFASFSASAQNKSSFDSLNYIRIKTNETGMKVLITWSVANIVAGGTGYFIANDKETKAFHEMNALWGIVNLGIAGLGYSGARKELKAAYNCKDELHRWQSNKQLYLINFGLDVGYISAGLLLDSYAGRFKDPETWHGFGKSIAMQGAFLFVFDGVMFSLHQSKDKKWFKLLDGLCVTGNGIGFRYGL